MSGLHTPLRRRPGIARTAIGLLALAGLAALALTLLGGGEDKRRVPAKLPGAHVASGADHCKDEGDEAGSAARPFCSVAAAVRRAKPGTQVLLHAGSYPALALATGPRRPGYVTIRPYRSQRVILKGLNVAGSSYVRLRGMRITGQVLISNRSHHVQLVGNELARAGVTVRAPARRILLARNHIHDVPYRPKQLNGGYGVLLAGWGAKIKDVTLRGNRIHDIPIDGIQVSNVHGLLIEGNDISGVWKPAGSDAHSDPIQLLGGSKITIRSNYIHDNSRGLFNTDVPVHGLTLDNNLFVRIANFGAQMHEATNLRMVNNTFWDTRWGVALRDNVRKATVKNNIFDHFESGAFRLPYEDHNLIAGGNSYGANDIEGPPLFVNREARDYRLAPGSPAIDAGEADGAPATDRSGRRRAGPPDLGAQER